jgi:hypothetical protein
MWLREADETFPGRNENEECRFQRPVGFGSDLPKAIPSRVLRRTGLIRRTRLGSSASDLRLDQGEHLGVPALLSSRRKWLVFGRPTQGISEPTKHIVKAK